jgi:hypothetical protein
MTPLLLLAAQAASAPAPPSAQASPVDVRTIDFDLKHYKPAASDGCGDPAAPGGIIVCGRRLNGDGYPLDRMAKLFEQGPLDAETGLFGTVRGRVFVDHVTYSNGEQANRIMLGIKLPF